jgi:hypothetical protein
MANGDLLNTPVIWVNKYLQSKLSDFGFDSVPFFPTTPSTIDSLTQTFTSNGIMATYDRMFKMNRKGFPHIKCEQLLYYFYATAENTVENMVQITEAVYRLLDRADESAQEVNSWCSNRRVNVGTSQQQNLLDNIFYFHNFKVYQLEETRDIIDFGTAGGNKIIIDFDYHVKSASFEGSQKDNTTYSDWSPEAKLSGNNKIII